MHVAHCHDANDARFTSHGGPCAARPRPRSERRQPNRRDSESSANLPRQRQDLHVTCRRDLRFAEVPRDFRRIPFGRRRDHDKDDIMSQRDSALSRQARGFAPLPRLPTCDAHPSGTPLPARSELGRPRRQFRRILRAREPRRALPYKTTNAATKKRFCFNILFLFVEAGKRAYRNLAIIILNSAPQAEPAYLFSFQSPLLYCTKLALESKRSS